MNSLSAPYHFSYKTTSPVTAGALADSLMGLEGIAEKSLLILKQLAPHIGPMECQLLVTSIEIGSYNENFIYRLIFGKGKAAEKKIDELRTALKLDNMDPKKIVAIAVSAALVYGVWLFAKPDEPANVHIINSFNSIGTDLNMSHEEVIALLDSAIHNKEDLKRKTVKLIRPQGDTQPGDLSLTGPYALRLPAEALKSIPAEYSKPEKDEPETELKNVPFIVRAMDLDRPGTGWAAILPELDERRLPLALDPGINPLSLPPGKIIYGDLTVIHSLDRHGNKKAKRYLLHQFSLKQK